MSEPATVQRLHQIGEVAEAVGLSLRTIRHYEEVGLVPPSGRTSGGFRLYTDHDIDQLELVKQMKPLGFTLEEMADLLRALDMARTEKAGPAQPDRELRDRLDVFADAAESRCTKLRDQLVAGEALARMLRGEARRQSRIRQR